MVSDQPTRTVQQMLHRAGWTAGRTVGSHTAWKGPNGTPFSLPDGHRTISVGVYKKLVAAIEADNAKGTSR